MADSQKRDNLLNLSLDATEAERERSLELETGYNPVDEEWELIVKYSGSLDRVREFAVSAVELYGGYAVVVLAQSQIARLSALPEIEYIEKPKPLFFAVENGRRVSCINPVQGAPFSLSGEGTIVALIDSGIDYELADFRSPDGTTRILSLWDQTIQGNPPDGYAIGTEYTREQINEALSQSDRLERMRIVPSRDTSGHGTSVAGIAAGNGRGGNGRYRGVATKSEMIVVKLGYAGSRGFPRTTELMQAINYAIMKALEVNKPAAVNISFGNTYGSHDGTSLLERFIDDISGLWKNVICIGMGNEAAGAGHTSGVIAPGEEVSIGFGIQTNQTAISIQIWKQYPDLLDISILAPNGERIGPIRDIMGTQRFVTGRTELLLYYGEPSPYSTAQEIYLSFLPRDLYLDSGIWQIVLKHREGPGGTYELWMPSTQVLNRGTGFLYPKETKTLTIPSTASRAISVGAYNALDFTYADFSGRGYVSNVGILKPDLVAPGVDVMTTVPGGYGTVTGTSFATPFVTGSAALLMEWGIVRGNDPYLYGEKVKAYLRRGAKPLPGFTDYPNPLVGYGALCVRDSIPV